MYRLLIVDDEPMVADSLYDIFSHMDNFELDIYKAYSGVEAIEWLNRAKIDIVLTDIRMPGISGLQLLEEIYKNWPQCRVIFLTGYDEFEYVYKAIQYKGVGYLLKTESYDRIRQAVKDAVKSIEESLKMEEVLKGFDEKTQMASDLLKKEYLLECLNSHALSPDIQQQNFVRLAIPMNASSPVFLLVGRVDNFIPGMDHENRSQKILAFRHIGEKYLASKVSLAFITDEKLNLIWFIQPKNMETDQDYIRSATFISGMLETIQSASLNALNSTISFVFTEKPYAWEEIQEKYVLFRRMLNLMIGNGKEMVITSEIPVTEKSDNVLPMDNTIKDALAGLRKTDMLEAYLERGDEKSYFNLLKLLTGCYANITSMNCFPAQQIYMTLSTMLLSYINRFDLIPKVAFKIDMYRLMHLEEHKTWGQAADYLIELSKALFIIQRDEQLFYTMDVIKQIEDFIESHMKEDLSLVRLSETFHFNASYLSRLFKQEEGLNLSDYILNVRLRKAKLLLSQTNLKILDISEAVGYYSATSFGRFFKKATGFTPQEYRDRPLEQVKDC